MKQSQYYAAAVSAFVIWGFFSLALKPLAHYPSLDILFYRVFMCVLLMLFINLVFRKKQINDCIKYLKTLNSKQKRNLFALTLTGSALLSANWFLFIYVMNHISVKAASFAYLVCPILTTVFAYFILKDQLSKTQWFAVGLSVISCALLGFGHFTDVFYSLIIAATYALYLIIQKRNVSIDKFLLLSIQLLLMGIFMLPFYPIYSGPVPVEINFYLLLFVIAIVFTIIPLFLNLFALRGISSSSVGILLYINPLINFFLALFYYNEPITINQLLAYTMIIVSIFIFNYKIFLFGRKNNSVN